MKLKILMVDDSPEYLKDAAREMEGKGFSVFPASNEGEAFRTLQNERIDLAIVDLRLTDSEDLTDTSGLSLAKEIRTSEQPLERFLVGVVLLPAGGVPDVARA